MEKNNIQQAIDANSTGGSLYKEEQEERKERKLEGKKDFKAEGLIIQTARSHSNGNNSQRCYA